MTTTTIEKLKREIKKELIAEFIVPMLKKSRDSEGEYREDFVRDILKLAKQNPRYRYNRKTFLKLFS